MNKSVLVFSLLALGLVVSTSQASAQDSTPEFMTPATLPGFDPKSVTAEALATSILTDRDGDGVIEIAAFGDSITRGEGDFIKANQEVEDTGEHQKNEAGYPLRIETFMGIPVSNLGVPGEALLTDGVPRFLSVIPALHPDFVVIGGGSNDGRPPHAASPGEYFRGVQTMVNVSRALGIQPIVMTIVPACCGHQFLQQFIDSFNAQGRLLAAINEIPLADVNHAYNNTCNVTSCRLLNRPEGLHPNIEGYDVMGEVVISTLLNINIFAPEGPTLLAQALAIPVESIRTVPDPLPPAPAM